MKFGQLKTVINRHPGRHDWISISIGLGVDAVIQAESPMLDTIDDYEVDWIAPSTLGEETVSSGISTVSDEVIPAIEVHLKERIANHDETGTIGE